MYRLKIEKTRQQMKLPERKEKQGISVLTAEKSSGIYPMPAEK